MAMLSDLPLGCYLPGDSFLHRLDPRLKLIGLPALVVASFAAGSPARLAGLALLGGLLAVLSGTGLVPAGRGLWAMRYLFGFTLLLHLLLSPGRTLWGTGWLSYDGLLQGATVCAQLALAILFSSLLTLTTSPFQLAAGLTRLLSPLARRGWPVAEGAQLLLLVLQFIPLLRSEAERLWQARKAAAGERLDNTLWGRARAVRALLGPLIAGLVQRADELARELTAGKDPFGCRELAVLPLRLASVDLGAAGLLLLFIVVLFGTLP